MKLVRKTKWKAKFYLKLHLPPHSGRKEQIRLYTKEDAIDVNFGERKVVELSY